MAFYPIRLLIQNSLAHVTPSTIIQASLIALLGLLAYRFFQRPRLHLPPGPFPLPMIGNWLRFRSGITPRNLADVAKQYGDVCFLRMGARNVVVVSSPEMAREVLQTKGVEFGSRARNLVFDRTTGGGQDLVFADYGEHWRKMRRISTLPFFTNKIVQQSRQGWEEEIEIAVEDIRAMPTATTTGIFIKDRFELAMYNILYRMMFDRRFDGSDDPLYVKLTSFNEENGRLAASFKYNIADFVPVIRIFLRGYMKKVAEANQHRLDFLRDAFLRERTTKHQGGKLGVDFFVDAHLKGEITDNNVLYLIQNMNVAAIDTVVWSFEWSIAELVNRPHIQRKVRNELDTVLGKNVAITEPDVAKLPYLQALVKEILRVHMVVPMLIPHRNLEAAKLGGYDIPADCKILVNAWGIANDPKYWDKPEQFQPERFLGENVELNGTDFRLIPFGSGRRSCPGMMIGLSVLGLVLGRLMQVFELLPPPGMDKVDTAVVGGQFSQSIAKKSKVIVKPRDL